MVMTSRPPPLTSSTRSNPSVRTSKNSISEYVTKEKQSCGSRCSAEPCQTLWQQRIQFSSPSWFRGGPGIFSSTNRASCDLFTMTSFSFTAVCIRRTLDWSLFRRSRGKLQPRLQKMTMFSFWLTVWGSWVLWRSLGHCFVSFSQLHTSLWSKSCGPSQLDCPPTLPPHLSTDFPSGPKSVCL